MMHLRQTAPEARLLEIAIDQSQSKTAVAFMAAQLHAA